MPIYPNAFLEHLENQGVIMPFRSSFSFGKKDFVETRFIASCSDFIPIFIENKVIRDIRRDKSRLYNYLFSK
jgi:hypothetical protein